MTPIPESGTRRDPIEPAVGHPVFTNLMACFRCDGCGALSIASLSTGDTITAEEPWRIVAILTNPHSLLEEPRWYPVETPERQYLDVPDEIGATASEAHSCMTVKAHRGIVLLARSVIEATAKDKGMTTGNLMSKIDAMYEARLIREDIRDGAHEVRYLANEAAHGDFVDPVPQTDAELILTLMDEVLEEVYQSPARVARRREARLARAQRVSPSPSDP